MLIDQKKKKKYDKGGYHPENGRRIQPQETSNSANRARNENIHYKFTKRIYMNLKKSFFGFNSGLERRFPYRFTIEDYTAEDLCKIYQTILVRSGWKINQEEEKKMVEFFRKERQSFKFNGGDLENFVHFSKLAFR